MPHKILVKDLDLFIKKERLLFASGSSKKNLVKRIYVKLHAGPGVERYIVEDHGKWIKTHSFTSKSEAVKLYNEL